MSVLSPTPSEVRLVCLQVGPPRLWAQEVVTSGCELGESPVWDHTRQKMYWVDAPGQRLWEWDLATSARNWQFTETVGCVALMEADGHVLLGLVRPGSIRRHAVSANIFGGRIEFPSGGVA
eukprot:4991504-Pyramimonas_sp.AAC.2